MHLEVLVGAVAEELLAARPEVGEPGDDLKTLAVHWSRDLTREFTGAKDGLNAEAALRGDNNDPASRCSDRGRSPDPVCR
jgi:hypothetical protein